jgi:3-oxoacyl-[acyl-carrier protein] reductase
MRFDHKVAFVTGAAKGIGAAIAERFVETGAAVAIFDIDGAAASATAARLCPLGRVLVLEGDVANEGDVETAVRRTAAELGPIEIGRASCRERV